MVSVPGFCALPYQGLNRRLYIAGLLNAVQARGGSSKIALLGMISLILHPWRTALLEATLLAVSSGLVLAQNYPPGAVDLRVIDRYIRAEMELNQVPGLALAIVRGNAISTKAYGVKSLRSGEPMTPDTPVELASVSKPFTALAVLQLVKAGKLNVELPVVRYLPELSTGGGSAMENITVRHLLRHTSGFTRRNNFLVPCCGQPGEFDLDLAVRKLRAASFRHAPGTRFAYANSNYVLLAALVERLSGLPFPAYMRTHVFLPLGMPRTTLDRTEALGWGLAEPHERQWGRVRPSPSRFFGWYGASLVKSTASDMGRFLAAVLSRDAEVLPAGMWLDPPYDWGWFITPRAEWLDGSLVLEHTGDVWGGNTAALIAPERKLGVAVLLNAGVDRAGEIARGVLARTAGRQGPDPGVSPRINDPDFWAICFTMASAFMLAGLVVYVARVRAEFRRGERRFAGMKDWRVRARVILLLGMAGCSLIVALGGEGPPPASLPSTLRVALPLLAASFAGILTAVALSSLTAKS